MGSHLVAGQWLDTGEQRPITNPADGSLVGHLHYADGELARAAADAAAEAFPAWSTGPARERADLLREAARLVDERSEEIGTLLAREAGKRLPEGIGELRFSAEYLRWFSEECRRPHGQVHEPETAGRRHLSVHRAAGVAASLTPWNFPCSIQARKLAPALAAGCTVVARVSEKAPLAVTEMVRALQDAGLPDGVLNLVHGPADEVTRAYLEHPSVRVVSFTGSTAVGQKIMQQAAERVVRPLLELGGDAPFVVFEDADLDAAVDGAMLAKFRNTGQSCIGANRFIVHESVFDDFTARLAARIGAMSVGDGLADPTPDLSACIDDRRVKELRGMVEEALSRGARQANPDVDVPSTGSYCPPALLVDVATDCALATEEVFGPVAAAFPFRSEDEAVAIANNTEMGLAGYVWTRDHARAWRMTDRIDVGILGINDPLPSVAFAPMGGVKQSGLGREGASIGLEDFQETIYVAMQS